ncbi:MAG: Bacterial alpha-L-rhamnosidase [Chitinophagaceae bacterium]|nr:Bacterial alpha-L-rhamnosidase [Chitinophagaceae bacterium]
MRTILSTFFILSFFLSHAQTWKAKWIAPSPNINNVNTWIAYRKEVIVNSISSQPIITKIATDTKYWLWINGVPVVFEGGLKRGPTPNDTYYDEIDIASYLKPGKNIISLLEWYFGKEGYSHKSSKKAGILFDCESPGLNIYSDNTWKCSILDAYSTAGDPLPNERLAESSILYDSRKNIGNWQSDTNINLGPAVEIGNAGDLPWNQLILRPIPFWKDYGLKNYPQASTASTGNETTITATLPYDAQIHPYFKIDAPEAGMKITVCTDNYLFYDGSAKGLRFEYLTVKGVQEFEIPAWLNGHKVYYILPKSIQALDLEYRETGYDANFEGSFKSSDTFFNKLWEKARRTLYVNMRDNYMDCPDRERAQWAGDAVHESVEAAYSLSASAHALTSKWLHEVVNWQEYWGPIRSPRPSGNIELELSDMVLNSVGYYGAWTYYMQTGDKQTLSDLYTGIQNYINIWYQPDGNGMVKERTDDTHWGDRTENDTTLIFHTMFCLALEGLQNMATALGKKNDADDYLKRIAAYKAGFNKQFWNGSAYKSAGNKGETDERAQALAVLAGIAGKEKYPALFQVIQKEEHASTYMEKYVAEALFVMGYGDYALERLRKRYDKMVNDNQFTTLWEDWNYGYGPYGGSTVNHGWSGGPLIILSQYLCGIAPEEPGYKVFHIIPNPASIKKASAGITSVAGVIKTSYDHTNSNVFNLTALVPPQTQCIIGIENKFDQITLNNKIIWERGKFYSINEASAIYDADSLHIKFKVREGNWNIIALNFTAPNRQFISILNPPRSDSTICKGDTLVLSATGGILYHWYRNDTLLRIGAQSFLNVWDSGVYYVITHSASGKTDTSKKYHVYLNGQVSPPTPVININQDKVLVSNYPSGNQWYFESQVISGANKPAFKPEKNGNYFVRVTINTCTSPPSSPIFYLSHYAFQLDHDQYLTLFPNPASDIIKIYFQLSDINLVAVKITNIQGQLVKQFLSIKNGSVLSLNGLVAGIYTASIIVPGRQIYSLQLIKN